MTTLPITTTSVEFKPCVKASERSLSPAQKPFILEKNMADCTLDKVTNKRYDLRYTYTGYATNLEEIEDDSNVLDDLNKYMPPRDWNKDQQKQMRKQSDVYFWTRPTIPFSLKCET